MTHPALPNFPTPTQLSRLIEGRIARFEARTRTFVTQLCEAAVALLSVFLVPLVLYLSQELVAGGFTTLAYAALTSSTHMADMGSDVLFALLDATPSLAILATLLTVGAIFWLIRKIRILQLVPTPSVRLAL